MADIFISYARDDRNTVKMLADALEEHELNIWWDDRIDPGKPFDDVILKALDKSRCIIVLWSKASIKSQWVKEEALEGLEREILIPVLIEDVNIPIGFRRIQAAQLIGWQGNRKSPMFLKLLSAISEMLEKDLNNIPANIDMSKSHDKLTPEVSWSCFEIIFALFVLFFTGIASLFWWGFGFKYLTGYFPGEKIVIILGIGLIWIIGLFIVTKIPNFFRIDEKEDKSP